MVKYSFYHLTSATIDFAYTRRHNIGASTIPTATISFDFTPLDFSCYVRPSNKIFSR